MPRLLLLLLFADVSYVYMSMLHRLLCLPCVLLLYVAVDGVGVQMCVRHMCA